MRYNRSNRIKSNLGCKHKIIFHVIRRTVLRCSVHRFAVLLCACCFVIRCVALWCIILCAVMWSPAASSYWWLYSTLQYRTAIFHAPACLRWCDTWCDTDTVRSRLYVLDGVRYYVVLYHICVHWTALSSVVLFSLIFGYVMRYRAFCYLISNRVCGVAVRHV